MTERGGSPREATGVCIWLTGLSGAGKTTTAVALSTVLRGRGYAVTLLDGDALRRAASADLGFSKRGRDANVLRAARAARGAVARGEIVICALISPYRAARAASRCIIGGDNFIEVFVDTPLATCQARDPKGLYAAHRRGEVRALSGLDDPYEAPLHPELRLETDGRTPVDNVKRVLALLTARHFIAADDASERPPSPRVRS
jgi:sulfate adenylyltransferase